MMLMALLLAGCVDPYHPDFRDDQVSLVVEALITDRPGLQVIYLSKSTPLNDTATIPITGALVTVTDDLGGTNEFQEEETGMYTSWISGSDLVGGRSYRLHIVTSDGELYESEPEMFPLPSPPMDSLYWEFETVGTVDPDEPLKGIRFYLDMDGEPDQARNFRWELVETWEYNAANRIQYYYDGTLHDWPDPFIYYTCWFTGRINQIFTASTRYFERNSITRFPLNYVSENSSRLQTRYSLLALQYSLSDHAIDYWEQIEKQNQEGGGIYETQPGHISGNIYNMNDPDEEVLGFFNLCSVSEKRIFVDGIRELHFPAMDCTLDTIMAPELKPVYMRTPFYLISLSPMGVGPPFGVGYHLCFDCRAGGGTHVKPDFWN